MYFCFLKKSFFLVSPVIEFELKLESIFISWIDTSTKQNEHIEHNMHVLLYTSKQWTEFS